MDGDRQENNKITGRMNFSLLDNYIMSRFKSWKTRVLLTYILRYMLIACICLLVFIPIRTLVHRRIVMEEMSSAGIELDEAMGDFNRLIYNLKFTANSVFASPECKRLSLSTYYEEIYDKSDEIEVSKLLQKYSYSLDKVSYLFVNFKRSQLIIDDYRVFNSFQNFYPGSLEVQGLNGDEFREAFFNGDFENGQIFLLRCRLNRGSFPGNYVFICLPAYINDVHEGNLYTLLSEKNFNNIFLSKRLAEKGTELYFDFPNKQIAETSYEQDNKTDDEATVKTNGEILADLIASDQKNKLDNKYLYVRKTNSEFNYSVILRIPLEAIGGEIRNIDLLLFFYMAIIIFISLFLARFLSKKEIDSLNKIYQQFFQNNVECFGTKKEDIMDSFLKHSQNLRSSLQNIESEVNMRKLDLALSGTLNNLKDKQIIINSLKLTADNYLILVPNQSCHDEFISDFDHDWQGYDILLIEKAVNEKFAKNVIVKLNEFGDSLIFISYKNNREENLKDICNIAEFVKKHFSSNKSIFVSSKFNSIEDLPNIHWQLRSMIQNRNNNEPIIYMTELDLIIQSANSYEEIRELEGYLILGQVENAKNNIRKLFCRNDLSLMAIREIYYNARGLFFSLSIKYKIDRNYLLSIFPAQEQISNRQSLISSLDTVCEYVCHQISSHRQSYKKSLREKIIAYIENNLSDNDLKAGKVASAFSLSSKYIAQLVKEETGLSFGDYINNLRMEHAKILLSDYSLNLSQIAELLGFSKPNTFYKSFKKYFGISPSLYRENINKK